MVTSQFWKKVVNPIDLVKTVFQVYYVHFKNYLGPKISHAATLLDEFYYPQASVDR